MSLALVAAPATPVIPLQDLKDFLRVDGSADDLLLENLLRAAQRYLDGKDSWLGRALVTQTWDEFLPCFPTTPDRPEEDPFLGLTLHLPPLQSVTSVKYLDPDGVQQTLPPADYLVDTKVEPGRLVPAYGLTWPATRLVLDAVEIRFVAGYGLPSAVPEDIKRWLVNAVSYFYQFREAAFLPDAVFWDLSSYRMPSP